MTELQKQISDIRSRLRNGVRLVAVSKFHPITKLREAYACGQRCFGESRAQELQEKVPQMPADTEWHFIGHLQQNKVKMVVPVVTMIHSVDSLHLLMEIDKQASRLKDLRLNAGLPEKVKVLLQLHVAQEATKFGFTPEELTQMLEEGTWRTCKNLEIAGLMCMATNTEDTEEIHREFLIAKKCFDNIQAKFFSNDPNFCECSWGMTEDYDIAMKCGSTIVRIGSGIFGEREY